MKRKSRHRDTQAACANCEHGEFSQHTFMANEYYCKKHDRIMWAYDKCSDFLGKWLPNPKVK